MTPKFLAREYGITIGVEHIANNGARVIPLEIINDGGRGGNGLSISYTSFLPDGRGWLNGDTTPNSAYYWFGAGKNFKHTA